jgi:hypothetical protein
VHQPIALRLIRTGLLAMLIAALFAAVQLAGPPAAHADSCDNEDAEMEECFIDEDGPAGISRAQTIDPIRPGGRRSLWIRTDSRSYTVGDRIRVCFGLPGPGYMRITDRTPDGRRTVLWEWEDDGRGDCMLARITPPTGRECVSLTYYGYGRPRYAMTCFTVYW